MRDDTKAPEEPASDARAHRDARAATPNGERPKLLAVKGKSAKAQPAPRGRPFQKGNCHGVAAAAARGAKRLPQSRLATLEAIGLDALRRIARHEYLVEKTADGRTRRRLVPLDASRANAIGNLIGRLMDLDAQKAGEEMQKIMGELESLRQIVGGMLDARS